MNRTADAAIGEKLLSLLALVLAIELVIFKFLPDIATGVIQGNASDLTDFALFKRDYLQVGTLAYTRFLGNEILWSVAQFIAGLVHSPDVRLHPLRIAAAVPDKGSRIKLRIRPDRLHLFAAGTGERLEVS